MVGGEFRDRQPRLIAIILHPGVRRDCTSGASWPSLPVITSRKLRLAWIALAPVPFFGRLSLAAVREMKVECGAVLLTGG